MRTIQIQRGISIGIEIGSMGKKISPLASFWGGTDVIDMKYNMTCLGGRRVVRGGASASDSAFDMERMIYVP